MVLILIGIGLYDEKDISLRGMEEAKKADKLYMELYTSFWHGSLQSLEKLVGKKITVLKRKDLEENFDIILDEAKNQNIVILVQGDPLVQTTHSVLILEARKREIKTKVIHNASIISAIAETGLHPQKFGPFVTIPFPEKTRGKLPESVYEVIKMNKARGLHTLCLLDVIAEENKYMTIAEALNSLLILEGKRRENVLSNDLPIIGISRLGSTSQIIKFGKLKDLFKIDFGPPPYCIIVPGILHFTEKEFLSIYEK
jgi:diphthine synthase